LKVKPQPTSIIYIGDRAENSEEYLKSMSITPYLITNSVTVEEGKILSRSTEPMTSAAGYHRKYSQAEYHHVSVFFDEIRKRKIKLHMVQVPAEKIEYKAETEEAFRQYPGRYHYFNPADQTDANNMSELLGREVAETMLEGQEDAKNELIQRFAKTLHSAK
jgi:hypothetical protein